MSTTRAYRAASIIVVSLTVLVGVASSIAIVLGRLSPAAVVLATTLLGYVVKLFISPHLSAGGRGQPP